MKKLIVSMMLVAAMAVTGTSVLFAENAQPAQFVPDWATDIDADKGCIMLTQTEEIFQSFNAANGVYEKKPSYFRVKYLLKVSESKIPESTGYVSRKILLTADSSVGVPGVVASGFQERIKEASGTERQLDKQNFLSVVPFTVKDDKEGQYVVLTMRLQTNYVRVSFAFMAKFTTIDGETVYQPVSYTFNYKKEKFAQPDPSALQPVVVNTNAASSSAPLPSLSRSGDPLPIPQTPATGATPAAGNPAPANGQAPASGATPATGAR